LIPSRTDDSLEARACESLAAKCLKGITLDEGTPHYKPFAHTNTASRAVLVGASARIFAWTDYLLHVSLADPLGARAKPFWPVIHSVLELLNHDDFSRQALLSLVLPLWNAEALDRDVRKAELNLSGSGQYVGGDYVTTLIIDFLHDDSLEQPALMSVGKDIVETFLRHLRILPLKKAILIEVSQAHRALYGPCVLLRSERLRDLPGLVDTAFVDAVLRVYTFGLWVLSKTHDTGLRRNAQEIVELSVHYLQHVFHAPDNLVWIEHALSHGLLPLLFQTRPWIDERDNPLVFFPGGDPVAYVFDKIILGHMFIFPLFQAILNSMNAMKADGTRPRAETRAWHRRIKDRISPWTDPLQLALSTRDAVIEGQRRCHYSQVSPPMPTGMNIDTRTH
jgi:hypothetical protein